MKIIVWMIACSASLVPEVAVSSSGRRWTWQFMVHRIILILIALHNIVVVISRTTSSSSSSTVWRQDWVIGSSSVWRQVGSFGPRNCPSIGDTRNNRHHTDTDQKAEADAMCDDAPNKRAESKFKY